MAHPLQGRALVLGIARDISERKHAEEELRQHRDHLEELVAPRTADLAATNERLEQEIAARVLLRNRYRPHSAV